MQFKIPIYSGIHKGQRRWLADMVAAAGRTDFSRREEVERLMADLGAFTDHLKEHAELEERFIHPAIGLIVPSCFRGIEAEHVIQHEDLGRLMRTLEMIRDLPRDHETLPQVGYEYYLALARFQYQYLKHIDFEEDHVQQIMLNDCTADQLAAIFKSILGAQSPESLLANLKVMFSGLSLPEMIGIFAVSRSMLPPQTYRQMMEQAPEFIGPDEWAVIQASLAKK